MVFGEVVANNPNAAIDTALGLLSQALDIAKKLVDNGVLTVEQGSYSFSLPPANEVWEGYVFTQTPGHVRHHYAPNHVPSGGYCDIRSMSGRYASYWNTFLFN